MKQRLEIISEHLQLKNDLNQSNKFKDESTKLFFEIETESTGRRVLFAKLSDDQKISLLKEFHHKIWHFESRYEKFANFLIPIVLDYEENKFESKLTLNEFIDLHFNKLLGFK